jgi:hypothetical protein
MNRRARSLLDETVRTLEVVRSGIPAWEGPLLTAVQQQEYREALERLRDFLDHILIYDTPAKLRNLKYSAEEVRKQQQALQIIRDVKQRQQRAAELGQLATYVLTAQQQVPDDHAWKSEAGQALDALFSALRQGQTAMAEAQRLQTLKAQYQDMYMQWHHQMRLNTAEEAKRQKLLQSPVFMALKALSCIELLPQNQLHQWQKSLQALKTCAALTKDELSNHPVCPHCGFRPRDEQAVTVTLSDWEEQLEALFAQWTGMLLDNLSRPEVQADLALLASEQQDLLRRFMDERTLPLPVEPAFVEAVRLLLKGIERVDVSLEEVMDVLGGGNPLTVDEVRSRFDRFLQEKLGSFTDPQRVRVMVRTKEE